jgi:hypothetical protein
MADIAKMVARLELEASKFQAGMERAQKQVARFERNTTSSLTKIQKQFSAFGSNLLKTFAVGSLTTAVYGLTRAVTESVKAGDELARFATKSGIGAKAASELAYAARVAEIDLEALTKGIKFMQVALSKLGTSDGKEAAAVLAAIGLNAEDLKKLAPEEQFLAIGDAIKRLPSIEDQTRAWQLFGRSGIDLAPAFEEGADGLRKMMDEAQRVGQSFTESDLQRFKDADAAFDKLAGASRGLAAAFTIKATPAIVAVTEKLTKLLTLDISGSDFAKFFLTAPHVHLLQLVGLMDKAAVSAEKLASTGPQGRSLPGLLPPAEGKGFGPDPAEIAKARAELVAISDPITQVTGKFEAQKVKIAELVKLYPQLSGVASAALKQVNSDFVDALAQASAELDKFRNQSAQIAIDIGGALSTIAPSMEENLKATQQYFAVIQEQGGAASRRFIELGEAIRKNTDEMSVFAEQAARNMQDAFADFLFDPFSEGLDGMLKGFLEVIQRMAAEAAAAQIFKNLFGGTEGLGGFLGTLLGGFGGGGAAAAGSSFTTVGMPGMASGGPVSGGMPYMVGEKGPEMFVPGASGSIIPNSQLGGSINYAPVINAQGADASLRAALPGILQEHSKKMIAFIQDQQQRGAM